MRRIITLRKIFNITLSGSINEGFIFFKLNMSFSSMSKVGRSNALNLIFAPTRERKKKKTEKIQGNPTDYLDYFH